MTPIERAARAIHRAEHGSSSSWDFEQADTGLYRQMARAAIEALREPTEPMQEAGQKAWNHVSFHMSEYHSAAELWKAMIDEALKP